MPDTEMCPALFMPSGKQTGASKPGHLLCLRFIGDLQM